MERDKEYPSSLPDLEIFQEIGKLPDGREFVKAQVKGQK